MGEVAVRADFPGKDADEVANGRTDKKLPGDRHEENAQTSQVSNPASNFQGSQGLSTLFHREVV